MLLKEEWEAELSSNEVSTGVVTVRESLVACKGMLEDASTAMLELTSVIEESEPPSNGEPWVAVKLVYIFFDSESIVFENWLGDEVITLDSEVVASRKELNDLCDDVEPRVSIGLTVVAEEVRGSRDGPTKLCDKLSLKEVSTGVVVMEEVAVLCVEAATGSTEV